MSIWKCNWSDKTASPSRLALVAVALALILSTVDARAQETLNNDAIVKLVQAHLSSAVILEQIRVNPGDYSFTTNSLIKLKQQGVPDNVIAAMQAKASGTSAGGNPPSRARTSQGAQSRSDIPFDKWKIVEWDDPMTSEHSKVIRTQLHGTPGGDFVVTVGCKDDSGIGFRVSSLGTRQLSESCSKSRMNLGVNGAVKTYQGDTVACSREDNGTDYSFAFMGNLSHAARAQGDQTTAVIKALPAGSDHDKATQEIVADTAGLLQTMLGEMSAQAMPGMMGAIGLPRMMDLVDADEVKVELPFVDGSTSIIHFSPQDPDMKAYTSVCVPLSLRVSVPADRGSRSLTPAEQSVLNLESAKRYAAAGDYASATRDYNAVLRFDGQNLAAKKGLADVQAAQANAQAAQAERAAQLRATQISDLLASAQMKYIHGDYAASIADYRRVLALDGANDTAKVSLPVVEAAEVSRANIAREDAAIGVWTDWGSHLMWTLKDNGSDINWKGAEEYCQKLRTGGFSDWRMATPSELTGIYSPGSSGTTTPLKSPYFYVENRAVRNLPAGTYWTYHIKGGITLTNINVWSGKTEASRGYDGAWVVEFARSGQAMMNPASSKTLTRALCVRQRAPVAPPPAVASTPASK